LAACQGFYKKYYLSKRMIEIKKNLCEVWRFFIKPKGLDLEKLSGKASAAQPQLC